jgi:hypothetical protein
MLLGIATSGSLSLRLVFKTFFVAVGSFVCHQLSICCSICAFCTPVSFFMNEATAVLACVLPANLPNIAHTNIFHSFHSGVLLLNGHHTCAQANHHTTVVHHLLDTKLRTSHIISVLSFCSIAFFIDTAIAFSLFRSLIGMSVIHSSLATCSIVFFISLLMFKSHFAFSQEEGSHALVYKLYASSSWSLMFCSSGKEYVFLSTNHLSAIASSSSHGIFARSS